MPLDATISSSPSQGRTHSSRNPDPNQSRANLSKRLVDLYGSEDAARILPQILEITARHRRKPSGQSLNESDILLITYADHIQDSLGSGSNAKSHLSTLASFAKDELGELVSGIHILPFFPASGDGGFAISDYSQVEPSFGDWSNISAIADNGRLMIDCVINHCSKSHSWFQGYLRGDIKYANYFIEESEEFDYSNVVRPRATPLFTKFDSVNGAKSIWTTFGEEQVDLNFRCPELLVDIVEITANFISKGADLLRFDASHFIWKESGTTCVNLEQTHQIIKILRDVIDLIDPSVIVINETNVPHSENITYFGDGHDEAQLVYNFALPSLLVHTFHKQDANVITKWAAELETPSEETHFFNYSACHDGIALRGASQILEPEPWQEMVDTSIERGAQILYRSTPDGDVPYEMCVTFFDILSDPSDALETQVSRFLVSQAIVLAMAGMPGIYFANFFGAATLPPSGKPDAHPRDGVREKYLNSHIRKAIHDPNCREGMVFERLAKMLRTRRAEPAFHPNAKQVIRTDFGHGIFAIERSTDSRRVLALNNVTTEPIRFDLGQSTAMTDLISGKSVSKGDEIAPLSTLWLTE